MCELLYAAIDFLLNEARKLEKTDCQNIYCCSFEIWRSSAGRTYGGERFKSLRTRARSNGDGHEEASFQLNDNGFNKNTIMRAEQWKRDEVRQICILLPFGRIFAASLGDIFKFSNCQAV